MISVRARKTMGDFAASDCIKKVLYFFFIVFRCWGDKRVSFLFLEQRSYVPYLLPTPEISNQGPIAPNAGKSARPKSSGGYFLNLPRPTPFPKRTGSDGSLLKPFLHLQKKCLISSLFDVAGFLTAVRTNII